MLNVGGVNFTDLCANYIPIYVLGSFIKIGIESVVLSDFFLLRRSASISLVGDHFKIGLLKPLPQLHRRTVTGRLSRSTGGVYPSPCEDPIVS